MAVNTFRYISGKSAPHSFACLRTELKTLLFLALLVLVIGWPRQGCTQAISGLLPVKVASDSLQKQSTAPSIPRRNNIKFSPLSLLGSSLSVFYERAISERTSVVAGYGSWGANYGFGNHLENGSFVNRRGTVELRRYWKNKGLSGWYVGPYLRIGQLQESHFVEDPPGQHKTGFWQVHEALVWVPGALVGHQSVGKWLVFDTFLGLQAQIMAGSLKRGNSAVEAMTTPVGLRLGLSVGVPFK